MKKNTAFLFAGQGAQKVGMGKDFSAENAAARAVFDMGERLNPGITHICFDGTAEELGRTENTQPALFLTDLAIAAALRAAGIEPAAVAGFSLGEIPALAFAGVMDAADAFRFVTLRGKSMAAASARHPGGMAAVLKLPADTVENLCAARREVWPVNYNCPGQISCAGCDAEIDLLCEDVKAAGGRAVKLAVSGAFHTPYMADVKPILHTFLDNIDLSAPEIPVYANRTAMPYPSDKVGIADCLSAQVCSPVRFSDTLLRMREGGIDTFVEVGAGATLTGFVKRTLPDAKFYTVNDMTAFTACLSEIGG